MNAWFTRLVTDWSVIYEPATLRQESGGSLAHSDGSP
jgi:hypothetical protein